MHRPAVLSALVLGLATCSRAPETAMPDTPGTASAVAAPASVMGAIVGMNVAWGDFHSRGDAAGIASLYTENAVLMTPEGDITGKATIRQYFERLFRQRTDSILATNTATETLDVAGNRAYEAGTVVFTVGPRSGPGAPVERKIRYMTFWQQELDGRWLIRYSLRPSPSAP